MSHMISSLYLNRAYLEKFEFQGKKSHKVILYTVVSNPSILFYPAVNHCFIIITMIDNLHDFSQQKPVNHDYNNNNQ